MEALIAKIQDIRTDLQILLADFEAAINDEPEGDLADRLSEAKDALHSADGELDDALAYLKGEDEDA